MAGRRLSMLKSLCKSTNVMSFKSCSSYGKFVNYAGPVLVRPLCASVARGYHTKESKSGKGFASTQVGAVGFGSFFDTQCNRPKPVSAFSATLSSSYSRFGFVPVAVDPVLGSRSYSSFFGNDAGKDGKLGVPAASSGGEVDFGNSSTGGSDLVDKVKN